MKIRRMLAVDVPIVFRIAMSLLFSMTRRTSEATMFTAATVMISPMVIEIAIFSSQSAEKSDLFICAQSCVAYSSPSRFGTSSATSFDANMSSSRSCRNCGGSIPRTRCATGRSTSAYSLSNS